MYAIFRKENEVYNSCRYKAATAVCCCSQLLTVQLRQATSHVRDVL